MSARLTSALLVGALVRRAEGEGGFAAVLAKGDPTAGAVLVILTQRGAKRALLERVLQPDGRYMWQDVGGQDTEKTDDFQSALERRRRYDPDLWIVELDIPSPERFAAEMNAAN